MRTVGFMIVFFFTLGPKESYGQYLKNKFDVSATVGRGLALGSTKIRDGEFKAPSLFNNFRDINRISIRITSSLKDEIRIGVSWQSYTMSGWRLSSGESIYSNSKVSINSIGPLVRYTFPIQLNNNDINFRVYGIINPAIDFNSTTIGTGSITNTSNPLLSPNEIKSNGSSLSATLIVGSAIRLNQKIEIMMESGFYHSFYSAPVSLDETVTLFHLNIGVNFKLIKNKRYYLP